MKPKRKVSQREVWLLALLPAALALIVSFAMPGPASKVADLEKRLKRVGGDGSTTHGQFREFAEQLQQTRQELEVLTTREENLSALIDSLNRPAPSGTSFNLAAGLDELTRRLSVHGAQVVAMESRGQSLTEPRNWVVRVVAPWPVMQTTISDANAFPPGLALSALNMQDVYVAGSSSTLRKWELVVQAREHLP